MESEGKELVAKAVTDSVITATDDEENSVTLVDILEEEAQLEEDANAVLGGSDDANCTFQQGHVKRQALYACVTCRSADDESQFAGICLACSYHCHDGHELVELYTKRNFCCDCGNSKFPTNKCTFTPLKDPANEKNTYNHNFKGRYCTCNKPYPDPDDSTPDEMIQCIICEDWFHTKHLGQAPPAEHDYCEMICDGCMNLHPFLNAYLMIDVTGDQSCKLARWESEHAKANKCKAAYFPERWRDKLCRCQKCQDLYVKNRVEFLLDNEDTVEYYEQKGKNASGNRPSHNDRLMMALSSLDRVQQVEAISQYQDFSAELKDYLKKFAENKKVVREEDILEFFGQLKERKRRRTDEAMPHFCR
nr:EOG090X07TK [Moina brachiata]